MNAPNENAPAVTGAQAGNETGKTVSTTSIPEASVEHEDILIDRALLWASQGQPVFPCYEPVNDQCSCQEGRECRSPGKHPCILDWPNLASTDEAVIRQWWGGWPTANLALCTGAKSGFWVLDVDYNKGGKESLERLREQYGSLPDTTKVRTGNGIHLYFKWPDDGHDVPNSTGKVASGIDVRGSGGYVIGVPSYHVSGISYSYMLREDGSQRKREKAPPWLLELARKPKGRKVALSLDTSPWQMRGTEYHARLSNGTHLQALRSRRGTWEIRAHTQPGTEAVFEGTVNVRAQDNRQRAAETIAQTVELQAGELITALAVLARIKPPQATDFQVGGRFQLPEEILEGQRNDTLFRHACAQRARGEDERAVRAALEVANTRCIPMLEDYELQAIARSAMRYEPGAAGGHVHASRFAEALDEAGESFARRGEKLYRYDAGVYRPDGAEFVRRKVAEFAETWGVLNRWHSKHGAETVALLLARAPALWDRPSLNVLNLKNGLLDVVTRIMTPHDPEHLTDIQLPVEYDPEARCPDWEQFVDQVFPEDAHGLVWEIVAWLMLPDVTLQKAVMLEGSGANGKGRLLSGLIAFLGKGNVSHVSLQDLEAGRFSASRLVGKLANIFQDLPAKSMESSAMFKMLTSGDRIQVEEKYQVPVETELFARVIVAANAFPPVVDASDAIFRRWLVIPFEKRFEGSEARSSRDIDETLADPRELSGVLNMALATLPQVRDKGFSEPASTVAALQEFRQQSDPLAVWLDRETLLHPEVWTPFFVMRDRFNEDARREARAPITEKTLSQGMKRLRHGLTITQRNHGGRRGIRGYQGIGLRPREGDLEGLDEHVDHADHAIF